MNSFYQGYINIDSDKFKENFKNKMKKTIKKKDIYKIKNNFIILFVILFIESNIYKEKTINHFPPKISIFLPIYNKAKYLKRSIKSIQIQTLKNIEIIPVNDCSEDNSLEVLSFFSFTIQKYPFYLYLLFYIKIN